MCYLTKMFQVGQDWLNYSNILPTRVPSSYNVYSYINEIPKIDEYYPPACIVRRELSSDNNYNLEKKKNQQIYYKH